MEDFVTLFDHKFLPQGLVLHDSLQRQGPPCRLWVVCMDATVFEQLQRLRPENLMPVPLSELESEELLKVKGQRTWAEYCWTLTPFACQHVAKIAGAPTRLTYVDADVAFFGPPTVFFDELAHAGKSVLITDHAYAPEYAHFVRLAGRFCVQFLTFGGDPCSREILCDWGEKCLAACNGRPNATEAFGDQKYLEAWPERFGPSVHILQNTAQTLAPWNVDYFQRLAGHRYLPVMYHFHGFRILNRTYARFSSTYRIRMADHIVGNYLEMLREQSDRMASAGIDLPCIPLRSERFWLLRNLKRYLFQRLVVGRHHLLG